MFNPCTSIMLLASNMCASRHSWAGHNDRGVGNRIVLILLVLFERETNRLEEKRAVIWQANYRSRRVVNTYLLTYLVTYLVTYFCTYLLIYLLTDSLTDSLTQ